MLHVRETLKMDSTSHPVTHWWSRARRGLKKKFMDSSESKAWSDFDDKGKVQLALNLAGATFKVLEEHFATGIYSTFLRSAVGPRGNEVLRDYLETIPEDIVNELPQAPKLQPSFILPKETVRLQKNKKISDTMLSKRPPEVEQIAPGRAMTDAERQSLRKGKLTGKALEEYKAKKAEQKRNQREKKQVSLYDQA